MRRYLQLGCVILLGTSCLHGAEMANLRNGFSIRHDHHEAQGEMTRLYLGSDDSAGYVDVATTQIETFETPPAEVASSGVASASRQDLQTIIGEASTTSQIDADFIASVIRAESANNPRAVSRKGAQGLMQLMPQTASNLGVKDSFDPVANVVGGVRYLRELLLQYNGDAAKALAAYNAGTQPVQQYHGVPPYYETHAYVARVINDYNRKKIAAAKHTRSNAGAPNAASDSDSTVNAKASGGK
jgi:soluble lytic murein transglycosylase-like protein